jgi:hypothetical protein
MSSADAIMCMMRTTVHVIDASTDLQYANADAFMWTLD